MLVFNLYDRDPHNEYTWHVGGDLYRMNEYGRQCVALQADGDELELIRRTLPNVPISNVKRVVRWSGEMAAFIAMNLFDVENHK